MITDSKCKGGSDMDNDQLMTFCEDSSINDVDENIKKISLIEGFAKVLFTDVDDLYPTDCDLRCRYFFKSSSLPPNQGDRIAIFKVGWKHVTEYYLFMMVTIPAEEQLNNYHRICFSAATLPKNINELYQLCYLTHDNMVIGASSPFGFYNATPQELVCVEDKGCQEVMVYKSRLSVLYDRVERVEQEKDSLMLQSIAVSSRLKQAEMELASYKKDIQLISSSSVCAQEELEKQKGANAELDEKYKLLNEEFEKCKEKLLGMERVLVDETSKVAALEQELICRDKEKEKFEKLVGIEKVLVNETSKVAALEQELICRDKEKEKFEKLVGIEKVLVDETSKVAALEQELICRDEENKRFVTELDKLTAEKIEIENLTKELNLFIENLKQELESTKYTIAHTIENQLAIHQQKNLQNMELRNAQAEISKLKEANERLTAQADRTLFLLEKFLEADESEIFLDTFLQEENSEISNSQSKSESITGAKAKCSSNDLINALRGELSVTKQSLETLREEAKTHNTEKEQMNKKLASKNDSINAMSEELRVAKQSLETLREEAKTHNIEKGELKKRIASLEDLKEQKIEELLELVTGLRSALLELPKMDEQWKLLLESARALGSEKFKKVHDDLMKNDHCMSTEIRNLLDCLFINSLCYDSLLEEHQNKSKELCQCTEINEKLLEDNTCLKRRVVELEETLKELNSCLSTVRKTNYDNEIKLLKQKNLEISLKRDELEKELKQIKTAKALSAIGQVTVNNGAATSVDQNNQSASELQDSSLTDESKSSEDLQSRVEILQKSLKKSAFEYAKLYQKLIKEQQVRLQMADVIKAFESSTLDHKQS